MTAARRSLADPRDHREDRGRCRTETPQETLETEGTSAFLRVADPRAARGHGWVVRRARRLRESGRATSADTRRAVRGRTRSGRRAEHGGRRQGPDRSERRRREQPHRDSGRRVPRQPRREPPPERGAPRRRALHDPRLGEARLQLDTHRLPARRREGRHQGLDARRSGQTHSHDLLQRGLDRDRNRAATCASRRAAAS